MSLRIGLLIYGSLETLSGGYLYDRRLAASLRAMGDQVEVISLPWRNYAAHLTDNLCVRLPAGLDVLIQDELNHPSLLAANRAPRAYPAVALVHHLRCAEDHPRALNAVHRAVERAFLRGVDGFIFNSDTTRAAVCALSGRDRPSVTAQPPCDRFGLALTDGQADARARQPGPLRVVFLGNLIPRKGAHTLLAALAQLPPGSVRLDVVGRPDVDPAHAARLRRQAAPLGPDVTFHGGLADHALADLLRQAHVLAVPSAYEGFGIVYLEGMGFGLPAIATTAGAASEIITPGRDGLLIPPGDATQLAAHLRRLAADRDLLADLSRGALQRYRRQPPWEHSAAAIRQFLFGLVAGKNP